MKRITFVLLCLMLPLLGTLTAQVRNDWDEMKLKGKVKVYAKLIYIGEKQNGKLVKTDALDRSTESLRTHFTPEGIISLVEFYNDTDLDKPDGVTKYIYNKKGQLVEKELSIRGDVIKDFYSYNKKGDIILHRREDPTDTAPVEFKYWYNYTPQGKVVTCQQPYGTKTISYYNNKNLLVKEEIYDYEGFQKDSNTYNNKGLLIKTVSSFDQPDEKKITTYTYDQYGNITSFIEKWNETTSSEFHKYTYNSNGNVVKKETKSIVKDDENEQTTSTITTYTYDAQGNLILEQTEISGEYARIVITECLIEYY